MKYFFLKFNIILFCKYIKYKLYDSLYFKNNIFYILKFNIFKNNN